MTGNTKTLMITTTLTLVSVVGLFIIAGWMSKQRIDHTSEQDIILVESLRNYLNGHESLVSGMVSIKKTGSSGRPRTLLMQRTGGYDEYWSDEYQIRATVLPEGLMQTATLTFFLDRKYVKLDELVPISQEDSVSVKDGFLTSSHQVARWMATGDERRYYDARSLFQDKFDDYFGSSESCYIPHDMYRAKEVAASISDGCGILLSQEQIMTFFDSIANRGMRARKRYFRKRRICKEETAIQMTALLQDNVTEGTGTALAAYPLKIAGKTGSGMMEFGHVPGKGLVSALDSVTVESFAGFFPADNPEYTMCVTLYSDTPRCAPGTGAMDLFGEIATRIKDK